MDGGTGHMSQAIASNRGNLKPSYAMNLTPELAKLMHLGEWYDQWLTDAKNSQSYDQFVIDANRQEEWRRKVPHIPCLLDIGVFFLPPFSSVCARTDHLFRGLFSVPGYVLRGGKN